MILVDESIPIGELPPPFPSRDVVVKFDEDMRLIYDLKKEIGRGRFGTVYLCNCKSTGLKFAAKFVNTKRNQDRENVEREIEVMKLLNDERPHPRLIQLYDAFDMGKEMCLVTEVVEGGELFERVIDDDFILTERACGIFIRQICEGIQFIHSKNVLHLDMKPENILCLSREGNRVKICDFGLARKYDPRKKLQVLFGTPEFVAPEVVNFEPISFGTDMWSVGVICYVLLSGLSPFMGHNYVETMTNVTKNKYDFDDEVFDEVSDEVKDFIESLLIIDKSLRLTPDQCEKHPWIKNILNEKYKPPCIKIPELDNNVIINIESQENTPIEDSTKDEIPDEVIEQSKVIEENVKFNEEIEEVVEEAKETIEEEKVIIEEVEPEPETFVENVIDIKYVDIIEEIAKHAPEIKEEPKKKDIKEPLKINLDSVKTQVGDISKKLDPIKAELEPLRKELESLKAMLQPKSPLKTLNSPFEKANISNISNDETPESVQVVGISINYNDIFNSVKAEPECKNVIPKKEIDVKVLKDSSNIANNAQNDMSNGTPHINKDDIINNNSFFPNQSTKPKKKKSEQVKKRMGTEEKLKTTKRKKKDSDDQQLNHSKKNLKEFVERWNSHPNSPYIITTPHLSSELVHMAISQSSATSFNSIDMGSPSDLDLSDLDEDTTEQGGEFSHYTILPLQTKHPQEVHDVARQLEEKLETLQKQKQPESKTVPETKNNRSESLKNQELILLQKEGIRCRQMAKQKSVDDPTVKEGKLKPSRDVPNVDKNEIQVPEVALKLSGSSTPSRRSRKSSKEERSSSKMDSGRATPVSTYRRPSRDVPLSISQSDRLNNLYGSGSTKTTMELWPDMICIPQKKEEVESIYNPITIKIEIPVKMTPTGLHKQDAIQDVRGKFTSERYLVGKDLSMSFEEPPLFQPENKEVTWMFDPTESQDGEVLSVNTKLTSTLKNHIPSKDRPLESDNYSSKGEKFSLKLQSSQKEIDSRNKIARNIPILLEKSPVQKDKSPLNQKQERLRQEKSPLRQNKQVIDIGASPANVRKRINAKPEDTSSITVRRRSTETPENNKLITDISLTNVPRRSRVPTEDSSMVRKTSPANIRKRQNVTEEKPTLIRERNSKTSSEGTTGNFILAKDAMPTNIRRRSSGRTDNSEITKEKSSMNKENLNINREKSPSKREKSPSIGNLAKKSLNDVESHVSKPNNTQVNQSKSQMSKIDIPEDVIHTPWGPMRRSPSRSSLKGSEDKPRPTIINLKDMMSVGKSCKSEDSNQPSNIKIVHEAKHVSSHSPVRKSVNSPASLSKTNDNKTTTNTHNEIIFDSPCIKITKDCLPKELLYPSSNVNLTSCKTVSPSQSLSSMSDASDRSNYSPSTSSISPMSIGSSEMLSLTSSFTAPGSKFSTKHEMQTEHGFIINQNLSHKSVNSREINKSPNRSKTKSRSRSPNSRRSKKIPSETKNEVKMNKPNESFSENINKIKATNKMNENEEISARLSAVGTNIDNLPKLNKSPSLDLNKSRSSYKGLNSSHHIGSSLPHPSPNNNINNISNYGLQADLNNTRSRVHLMEVVDEDETGTTSRLINNGRKINEENDKFNTKEVSPLKKSSSNINIKNAPDYSNKSGSDSKRNSIIEEDFSGTNSLRRSRSTLNNNINRTSIGVLLFTAQDRISQFERKHDEIPRTQRPFTRSKTGTFFGSEPTVKMDVKSRFNGTSLCERPQASVSTSVVCSKSPISTVELMRNRFLHKAVSMANINKNNSYLNLCGSNINIYPLDSMERTQSTCCLSAN